MRKSIVLAVLAVATLSGRRQCRHDHHATVQPDALKWTAPAAYGSGALLAVVKGDPSKEGVYVVRLKAPKGFEFRRIPIRTTRTSPCCRGLSVSAPATSSTRAKGETIKAGGYSYVAKGMTHYAFFPEETVIQLHGIGPQGITYVNLADDPRKK